MKEFAGLFGIILVGVLITAAVPSPHFDATGGGGAAFTGDLAGNDLSDSSDNEIGLSDPIVSTVAFSVEAGGSINLDDDVSIWLGTGGDSKLYYDGTDVHLHTDVVGSGGFILDGLLTLTAGMVRNYVGKDDGDSPYSTLVSDFIIGGDTSLGALTVDLSSATVTAGRTVIIKDVGGNAGTLNITVSTEGAETIDGAATFSIDADYQSVSLVSDGTNWFIY